MLLFDSAWQIISTLFVFLIGLLICITTSRKFNLTKKRVVFLYLWHTLFCIVYVLYALNNVSDAAGYYRRALNSEYILSFGTGAVVSIASPFVTILNLSFLGSCLLFNIFGSIGLIAFDASLKVATYKKSKLIRKFASLIILLPSISFWSSAIGKDSISFMATTLALWASLNLKKRKPILIIAFFAMLLVRPHMAGLMIIAFSISLLIANKIPLLHRFILFLIAVSATAIIVPYALNYSGVGDNAGAEEIIDYIEQRQTLNSTGGSSINIASMSPPVKLFTYLFRPLPIEANSIFSLAASLDNLILLILSIIGIYKLLKTRNQSFSENNSFLWIYSFLAWVILSFTTANLGISVRQKWMFTPILIFLLISVIGKHRNNTTNKPNTLQYSKPIHISTNI